MNLARNHPLLKRVRLMRKSSAARCEQGLLIAEGVHVAREALAAGCEIEAAIFDPRLTASGEAMSVLAELGERAVPCHEVATSVMNGLQDARSPQPLLLMVRTATLVGRAWRTKEDPLIVVCDGVQDPGNIGAIVRSTDAAGAAGLILTGSTADPHHPRSVRASMGSIFRLPIERMELAAATRRLRDENLTLIGTRVAAGEDYRDAPLSGACAVFFGSEGSGLEEPFLRTLDRTVTIPLHADVESLSVGAAVAVTLFEAVRQRRPSGPVSSQGARGE
jgi:TrmH family RNA methyltransferase